MREKDDHMTLNELITALQALQGRYGHAPVMWGGEEGAMNPTLIEGGIVSRHIDKSSKTSAEGGAPVVLLAPLKLTDVGGF